MSKTREFFIYFDKSERKKLRMPKNLYVNK